MAPHSHCRGVAVGRRRSSRRSPCVRLITATFPQSPQTRAPDSERQGSNTIYELVPGLSYLHSLHLCFQYLLHQVYFEDKKKQHYHKASSSQSCLLSRSVTLRITSLSLVSKIQVIPITLLFSQLINPHRLHFVSAESLPRPFPGFWPRGPCPCPGCGPRHPSLGQQHLFPASSPYSATVTFLEHTQNRICSPKRELGWEKTSSRYALQVLKSVERFLRNEEQWLPTWGGSGIRRKPSLPLFYLSL